DRKRSPSSLSSQMGEVSGKTQLNGMSLVFSRSDAQEQALEQLLAAQENASSPLSLMAYTGTVCCGVRHV
ncbi:MAG: hypothetical protein ACRYFU_00085, partial [Janthinobacterium lividum]